MQSAVRSRAAESGENLRPVNLVAGVKLAYALGDRLGGTRGAQHIGGLFERFEVVRRHSHHYSLPAPEPGSTESLRVIDRE